MGIVLRINVYIEGGETGLSRRGEKLNCNVVTSKASAALTGSAEAGLAFGVVTNWGRWLSFIPSHQPDTGVGFSPKGVVTFGEA